MVKGNLIKRAGESLTKRLNAHPYFSKGVLIIFLILFMLPTIKSQEADTLSMSDSKAQTLKYLKSLATIEKENCEKSKFFETYDIDLTSGKEVLITKSSWIKREPAEDSKNCNTLIPENSIVKIYDSSCSSEFYAVKFKNKWGFVNADIVEQFE